MDWWPYWIFEGPYEDVLFLIFSFIYLLSYYSWTRGNCDIYKSAYNSS
jgi:hypothetical protein